MGKETTLREVPGGVPTEFRLLFWDTELRNVDLSTHADYVIERVLEYGTLDAFRWLETVFSKERIRQTLNTSRRISARSRNFWLKWLEAANAQ